MNIRRLTLATLMIGLAALPTAHSAAAQKMQGPDPADNRQPGTVDGTRQGKVADPTPTVQRRNRRYAIQPSDTLELTFMLTPQFDQTVKVQPDGYITLRDVGDLRAAGYTLPELTNSIKTAYSKILRDPVISVDPMDFVKPYFVVGGQVGKPGKFDLRGNVTLTQAIAMAGGFTDAAKHSQVLLFRRVSDQWTEAKIINVKKMMKARKLQEDPELQPGDMLFVPKNALSKIKPFLPTSGLGAYYNPATF
jgi:protein involved in polysaccharide export with SLBB domain